MTGTTLSAAIMCMSSWRTTSPSWSRSASVLNTRPTGVEVDLPALERRDDYGARAKVQLVLDVVAGVSQRLAIQLDKDVALGEVEASHGQRALAGRARAGTPAAGRDHERGGRDRLNQPTRALDTGHPFPP